MKIGRGVFFSGFKQILYPPQKISLSETLGQTDRQTIPCSHSIKIPPNFFLSHFSPRGKKQPLFTIQEEEPIIAAKQLTEA